MRIFVKHEIEVANRPANIQFRVFNLKTKTFYPETEKFFLSSAGDCLMTEAGEKLSLKENVIQRCTGEVDIKGKLIYHGDILRTNEYGWRACVVWREGQFSLVSPDGGYSDLPDWGACEIVGNILLTAEVNGKGFCMKEKEKARDFWYACWNGDFKRLKKLLPSCRGFINTNLEYEEDGEKKFLSLPLIAALNSRHEECVRLLLQHGAKLHKICRNMKETPWSFAKNGEIFRQVSMTELLSSVKGNPSENSKN